MNIILDFINKNKNRIKYENIIIFICLLFLAIHYYPTAGRFLDADEEYFFYITSAISRGMGLFTDLYSYYPPLLWYICSLFFKFSSSLFQAMLATRIFNISFSLVGFYLIFDIFKKLKLSWFIIPATLFLFYSIQFDLKLIEYRADNALLLILILQSYFIFLLTEQNKFSPFKIFSIIFLGILTFHITQKAVYIEPFLMLSFLFIHFDKIKIFILKYKAALSLIVFGGIMLLIFSESYHRFFYQCYIYPSIFLKKLPKLFPEYSFGNKLDFLIRFAKHNIAFWLIGLASFPTFLLNLRRNNKYLLPLMFLSGTFLLLWMAPFPMLQYQLYCAWGVLFSLPFFLNICCQILPKKKIFIFSAIFLLALSGMFTFTHYRFPFKSLMAYAAEIDRVREVIEQNEIASFGGSSINIQTALPFCDATMQFRSDEKRCQSENIRGVLKKKDIKFIHLDPRKRVKNILTNEDSYFIQSNYQKCPNLPLLIASKWAYINSKKKYINIEIEGNYNILLFTNNNTVMLDNRKLISSQIVMLKKGKHSVSTRKTAVLLLEFKSDKINSENFLNVNHKNIKFISLNQDFSDKFKLLGVLKSKKAKKTTYRLFWKAISDINDDLRAFHHFIDRDGNYVTGINIDPTDGWYDIRNIKKGDVISFDFSVDGNKRFNSMNIGWYYKQDWSKRLECDGSAFFKLYHL